ncbi:MAG: rhodanese-like domain-containing protein [Thermodesulfobacteriota bacterium]
MTMSKQYRRLVPALVFASLLVGGPMIAAPASNAAEPAAAQQQNKNVYAGKILGVSKKAKSISIELDARSEMVKFDDKTMGMEFAKEGEGAVITFEERGGDKVATVIKPKVVKLPAGVAEIESDELAKLVAMGPEAGNYFLVDSRPAPRYNEAHIPTAISLPVPKMEETGATYLPGDAKTKNTMLVFYCGGPT